MSKIKRDFEEAKQEVIKALQSSKKPMEFWNVSLTCMDLCQTAMMIEMKLCDFEEDKSQ